jgi:hypothetical protein
MTVYAWRDAITGEYVTEEYAREHPDTTVREEQMDSLPGTGTTSTVTTDPPAPDAGADAD